MLSYYVFCVFFWNTPKSVNFEVVKLSRFGGKRTIKTTGLIINGTAWVNNLYIVLNKVTNNLILNPWGSITLENQIYVWVSKVTLKTRVILDKV